MDSILSGKPEVTIHLGSAFHTRLGGTGHAHSVAVLRRFPRDSSDLGELAAALKRDIQSRLGDADTVDSVQIMSMTRLDSGESRWKDYLLPITAGISIGWVLWIIHSIFG